MAFAGTDSSTTLPAPICEPRLSSIPPPITAPAAILQPLRIMVRSGPFPANITPDSISTPASMVTNSVRIVPGPIETSRPMMAPQGTIACLLTAIEIAAQDQVYDPEVRARACTTQSFPIPLNKPLDTHS